VFNIFKPNNPPQLIALAGLNFYLNSAQYFRW